MTQSLDIQWKEGGWSQQPPTAVINIDMGGKNFIMDLITYNENIELGKTEFVMNGDNLFMVTPEQYNLIKEFNASYKKFNQSKEGDFLGFSRMNGQPLFKK